MKLKTHELPHRIQSGPIPEVVLLFGQDQGLVETHAALVRRASFQEEHADFDLEVFFGGDLHPERFLSSCEGYPLQAARRLILLKEADRLSVAHIKAVIGYIKNPSPSTLLLILAGNLTAKSPLRKQCDASKNAWCVPFYPLEGQALRRWFLAQLQQDGFHVEPDALHYLSEHLAGDTRHTRQELDKLKLFMGEAQRIRLEDVLAMVGETTTYSGFGLAAAVTSGQVGQALPILERLLESGEEPLMLLGILSQRMRRLSQCSDLMAQGQNPKHIAARLQIFWKEQAVFFEQSRSIPARKLADGLLDCLEADRQLKGGSDAPPRQIMERLVMRMTSRIGGRRPG